MKETEFDHPGMHGRLRERRHLSRCRLLPDRSFGRFDARSKDRFRTVLKLIKQIEKPKPGRDPFLVKDRCGFKFVVTDVRAARDCR